MVRAQTSPGSPPESGPAAWPRITVVTPSYNQARFVCRCIDSVLGQSYPNLQYLVYDGGSTDGTVEILAGYGDAISWRSRRDRGQAAAINDGFRAAKGEFVAWLNSDDYYLPGALEHAVACFARHPEAAMVYGRGRLVDEADRTIRPYPTFELSRDDLARKCYVCQPAVFVRRSTLEQVGGLNEALDICIDYEWWLRIGRRHTMAYCDHELAASRVYPATKTSGRRLRALIEAGYLMREHFGRASWRWSAKWVVHQWSLDRRRFLLPGPGWGAAVASARRYRRRFDARRSPSVRGRRLLDRLDRPASWTVPQGAG